RTYLEETRIGTNARDRHRTACKSWNQAVDSTPEWPRQRVSIPSYVRKYAVDWQEFPSSLKRELDAYCDNLAGTNVFEERDFPPLSPGSIRTKRTRLQQFA